MPAHPANKLDPLPNLWLQALPASQHHRVLGERRHRRVDFYDLASCGRAEADIGLDRLNNDYFLAKLGLAPFGLDLKAASPHRFYAQEIGNADADTIPLCFCPYAFVSVQAIGGG